MQLLALRDEFLGRAFDLPDEWWVDQRGVIGGRDRRGGGSWCVSDIAAGRTAVVLNRPERPAAAAGAPSRGVLPLLGVRYREHWPEQVAVATMASFNLVLCSPDSLRYWSFDGAQLHVEELATGTHMFTPTGMRSTPLDGPLAYGSADFGTQHIADTAPRSAELVWPEWLGVVRESVPTEDRTGLLVRRIVGEDSYETVFGQLIAARPGTLRLDYLEQVAQHPRDRWTTRLWTSAATPGHTP